MVVWLTIYSASCHDLPTLRDDGAVLKVGNRHLDHSCYGYSKMLLAFDNLGDSFSGTCVLEQQEFVPVLGFLFHDFRIFVPRRPAKA